MNDRVDINESNLFVCAYPSGSIAELTQTRLLYENVRETTSNRKSQTSMTSKTKKLSPPSTPNSIELDPTITLGFGTKMKWSRCVTLRDLLKDIFYP